MANPTLLNNVAHKDLKVQREHNSQLNETTMQALAFPFEFKSLQNEYPIVFRKDPSTGQFQSVVLLGLEDNENLYLNEQGWQAKYVPLMVERQPFLIGIQAIELNGVSTTEAVVLVDMDSPKVNTIQGEALFLAHGGNSPYLEHIHSILHAMHERQDETQAFIDALLKYQLLESFYLDVELANQQSHRLMGYYTINEDKLADLPPPAVVELHQSGILQTIYMVVASLVNLGHLIDLKQQRLQHG